MSRKPAFWRGYRRQRRLSLFKGKVSNESVPEARSRICGGRRSFCCGIGPQAPWRHARATWPASARSRRPWRRRSAWTSPSCARARSLSNTTLRILPARRSSAPSTKRLCARSTGSAISSAHRGAVWRARGSRWNLLRHLSWYRHRTLPLAGRHRLGDVCRGSVLPICTARWGATGLTVSKFGIATRFRLFSRAQHWTGNSGTRRPRNNAGACWNRRGAKPSLTRMPW